LKPEELFGVSDEFICDDVETFVLDERLNNYRKLFHRNERRKRKGITSFNGLKINNQMTLRKEKYR
jgi:hypothetical protein